MPGRRGFGIRNSTSFRPNAHTLIGMTVRVAIRRSRIVCLHYLGVLARRELRWEHGVDPTTSLGSAEVPATWGAPCSAPGHEVSERLSSAMAGSAATMGAGWVDLSWISSQRGSPNR